MSKPTPQNSHAKIMINPLKSCVRLIYLRLILSDNIAVIGISSGMYLGLLRFNNKILSCAKPLSLNSSNAGSSKSQGRPIPQALPICKYRSQERFGSLNKRIFHIRKYLLANVSSIDPHHCFSPAVNRTPWTPPWRIRTWPVSELMASIPARDFCIWHEMFPEWINRAAKSECEFCSYKLFALWNSFDGLHQGFDNHAGFDSDTSTFNPTPIQGR